MKQLSREPLLQRGQFRVRLSDTPEDIHAAQKLRARVFRGHQHASDGDALDAKCVHALVEDIRDDALVCCFRMLTLEGGGAIAQSYSAQHYELSALQSYTGKMVEMGRFCVAPERNDPDILRVAWGAMTAYVDAEGVDLLFGCSSFSGTSEDSYLDAFSLLKDRHLAPKRWLPRVKAPRIFPFARKLRLRKPDLKAAMAGMPPLLRTYLLMGGWVSDHAVVDDDLNTLHVFTGVEIASIPPARKRLLRAVAGC